MSHNKRTKIVCTIGPASSDRDILEKMVAAGMNVARLNFSHGTHDDHAKMIAVLRDIAAKSGHPIALLQDLQGPKIRVGNLPKEGITLVKDTVVTFTTDVAAVAPKIPVTYDLLHQDVKVGDTILLDDGLLEVHVESVEGRDIVTRVVNGGPLTSHKGFNLPKTTLSVPSVTDKDKDDLAFGVLQNVDFVAMSFVRTAEEVRSMREHIAELEAARGPEFAARPRIRIIAKIEKHEAIRNIDAIIEEVDAIMVARGDLGIETPAEEVPLVQKRIIEKCLAAGKPVIVATQMLDSMIRNPRPTRAEVSDVANAVIDHTDAVMLSGESASGKFPLEAVETMAKIVHETEASEYDNMPAGKTFSHGTADVAVAQAASTLARDSGAKLILVASRTGDTVRTISRHRPELPVVAVVADERVQHQLNLSWGVVPFLAAKTGSVAEMVANASVLVKDAGLCAVGDTIVVVARGEAGENVVELVHVA